MEVSLFLCYFTVILTVTLLFFFFCRKEYLVSVALANVFAFGATSFETSSAITIATATAGSFLYKFVYNYFRYFWLWDGNLLRKLLVCFFAKAPY